MVNRKILQIKGHVMKEFIEKSGLTAAEFAKQYGIPYNTVRQWAEGIRKPPDWLKKLFESEQAYKPLAETEEKEKKNEVQN